MTIELNRRDVLQAGLAGAVSIAMPAMAQGAFPDEWIEETRKMLAIKRWGQPEEIGFRLPYAVGYAIGRGFDLVAAITGKRLCAVWPDRSMVAVGVAPVYPLMYPTVMAARPVPATRRCSVRCRVRYRAPRWVPRTARR